MSDIHDKPEATETAVSAPPAAPQSPMTINVVVPEKPKSILAAFLLAFLFGPLGLLYATVGGGIAMIVLALIIGPITAGLGLLLIWPMSMIWAVLAAWSSKPAKQNAA
ncbi:hypothetical protein NHN26_15740 [Rhodovulum tesquicola]|uniref:hypothetical protein n=1 Tax=Rhodovulum tesquicola TaxID=540254 RepID=UPI0020974C93|nr:hypothetical protein [Rhodovulum tesquicola]MCO8146668.1 hypothetical protein [Rhodovulum tesquicola]